MFEKESIRLFLKVYLGGNYIYYNYKLHSPRNLKRFLRVSYGELKNDHAKDEQGVGLFWIRRKWKSFV